VWLRPAVPRYVPDLGLACHPFRLHGLRAAARLTRVTEGWPHSVNPAPLGKPVELSRRGSRRAAFCAWVFLLACLGAAVPLPAATPPDLLTPAERSWIEQHGSIRYAADSTLAPIEYARADGAVAGIAPDLVAHMARNLAINIVAIRCPTAADAQRVVELGQADFGAGVVPASGLLQRFEFTQPYLHIPGHWFGVATQPTPGTPTDVRAGLRAPDQLSLHFNVAKGNPLLLGILEKGVASLTESQRLAVLRRWTVPDLLLQQGGGIQTGGLVALLVVTGLVVFAGCRVLFRRSLARQGRAHAEIVAQHQAAEAILRRSHEHAQAILRNAPFGTHVYRLHSDGRLMLAETNAAADRSLGAGRSSLVGLPLEEIFPVWRGTDLMEGLRRVAREGGTLHRQLVPDPSGKEGGIYDLQGFQTLPGRVAVLFTDVTERQQAEASIRQRAATLTAILNAVPQWVFWKDSEGYYLGCNQAFARGVGIDVPSSIVGKSDFDLPWSPREAEAQRADDREVIEENRPKRHPRQSLPLADGTYLLADVLKVPLAGASGEVLGVLGVGHDITGSTRVEEALQRAMQTLQDALDSLPFRVGWKDRNLGYLGANRAFALAAGVPESRALVGRNDFDLSWRAEAESLRADDRQVLESGQPLASRVEPELAPDGREVWLRTTKIPLRDASDQIVGVLEVVEDITERRRSERASVAHATELEQRLDQRAAEIEVARQQLQALTQSLARDLHAPLRAIDGYAGMLAQAHGDGFNPEGLRLMDVLQRETRRMGQVIQTLLDQYPVFRPEPPPSGAAETLSR
jgi:PAS domain S-box-containing protein